MKINGSAWNINVFLLIAAYVEKWTKLRREFVENFLWRVEKVKVFHLKRLWTKMKKNISNIKYSNAHELEDFICNHPNFIFLTSSF